ncbi:unnamed protein product [Strongylus vulgaris]|uniref:Uncharacterized protein n=1 Tax=Strongylus vulgaris TaxID=40348 RepID=A0A3P7K249_STRVU|nr:unnamed protein product [Strongylus vulgaris]
MSFDYWQQEEEYEEAEPSYTIHDVPSKIYKVQRSAFGQC